jgi:hypothetical protein
MEVLASRLTWRRLPWPVEVVSIGIGYAFYAIVRVLAPHRVNVSYDHASQVRQVEQSFGIYHELTLNQFITGRTWLEVGASYYYASAHFIITPLLLAWIWKRRQRAYAPLRSAIVIATAGALVVYATWPLAPPRYAMAGAVDTVIDHPVAWASGHGVEGFVNDLAAMPSLHVGWAVWCAVAVTAVFHSRWRYLAWLYPLGTTLVVVATANHYVLDAVGGAFVVGLPMYLCGLRLTRTLVSHPASEQPRVAEACAA